MLSRNHAEEGERARPGRRDWRPRQSPLAPPERTHRSVAARAGEPPGEGAGWQRPGRACSPFPTAWLRLSRFGNRRSGEGFWQRLCNLGDGSAVSTIGPRASGSRHAARQKGTGGGAQGRAGKERGHQERGLQLPYNKLATSLQLVCNPRRSSHGLAWQTGLARGGGLYASRR